MTSDFIKIARLYKFRERFYKFSEKKWQGVG